MKNDVALSASFYGQMAFSNRVVSCVVVVLSVAQGELPSRSSFDGRQIIIQNAYFINKLYYRTSKPFVCKMYNARVDGVTFTHSFVPPSRRSERALW